MLIDELKGGVGQNVVELQTGRRDFETYAKANLPRKIEALLDHKDFQSKLSWIAKQVGASLDEAQDALDLLEGLGIISWDNGRIVKKIEHVAIDQMAKMRTRSHRVNDHRIISHQLLNDIDGQDEFFVRNGFTCTDEVTMRAFYEKIREVEQWFIKASRHSQKTLVAGYSLTGTNTLKSENEGDFL